MPVSTFQPLADEPGIRLGLGCACLIMGLVAAVSLEADPHRTLVLLLVVIAGSSVRTTVAVGAGIGGLGWALDTGFVVNRYGQLTFGGADLTHLVLLIAAGAGAAAVTSRSSRGRTGVTP